MDDEGCGGHSTVDHYSENECEDEKPEIGSCPIEMVSFLCRFACYFSFFFCGRCRCVFLYLIKFTLLLSHLVVLGLMYF